MKPWLKRLRILLLAIIAILIIWEIVAPPDSDDCSICGHLKCHAPCILNLATGEIDELELYQPHFQKVGEIAEEQTGGTFSFIHPAGLQGIRLTDPWYIEVSVPMEGERKNKSFFCEKCRKLLGEYKHGFVVLDMYDIEKPVAYGIDDGAIYHIRCYRVTITIKCEMNEFRLRMDGMINHKS